MFLYLDSFAFIVYTDVGARNEWVRKLAGEYRFRLEQLWITFLNFFLFGNFLFR